MVLQSKTDVRSTPAQALSPGQFSNPFVGLGEAAAPRSTKSCDHGKTARPGNNPQGFKFNPEARRGGRAGAAFALELKKRKQLASMATGGSALEGNKPAAAKLQHVLSSGRKEEGASRPTTMSKTRSSSDSEAKRKATYPQATSRQATPRSARTRSVMASSCRKKTPPPEFSRSLSGPAIGGRRQAVIQKERPSETPPASPGRYCLKKSVLTVSSEQREASLATASRLQALQRNADGKADASPCSSASTFALEASTDQADDAKSSEEEGADQRQQRPQQQSKAEDSNNAATAVADRGGEAGGQIQARAGAADHGCRRGAGDTQQQSAKTFVVTVDNGWTLVESHLRSQGWIRLDLEEKNCSICDLAWVSNFSLINFELHRRGQLINHIPNASILCDKAKLAQTMSMWYLKMHPKLGSRLGGTEALPKWMPMTFLLANEQDSSRLLRAVTQAKRNRKKHGGPPPWWIVKPGACNQGTGIFATDSQAVLSRVVRYANMNMKLPEGTFLVTNQEDVELALWGGKAVRSPALVQSYIMNPVLLRHGLSFARKFDLRCFAVVARTKPLLVLGYPKGYGRLAMEPWYVPQGKEHRARDGELQQRKEHEAAMRKLGGECGLTLQQALKFAHLNNVCIQKEHPRLKSSPGGYILPWKHLSSALAGEGRAKDGDWVLGDGIPPGGPGYADSVLQAQLFQIMTDVLWKAGGPGLTKREGYFELFGFDFMLQVETSGRLYPVLIEVNRNPGLSCDNSPDLQDFKPTLVASALNAAAAALPRRRVKPDPGSGESAGGKPPEDWIAPPWTYTSSRAAASSPFSSVKDHAGAFVVLGDEQTGFTYRSGEDLL
eukprot:TRINITY_DN27380_c0_g1_i1.p1 TRINITY_DN27380_c0_g1~~TRINITY_DN27380_c0_g1_i1.p1  ORF type:complete len:838 (-),score=169.81 TRINITY_DN27380_c0_g1_i1:38-2551(-)